MKALNYTIIVYLRYMRNWMFVLFFLFPLLSVAQENVDIKNKYLGKYKGTIPSFQIQSDKGVINVSESSIYIDIQSDDAIGIKIGNQQMQGTYRVLFKAKTYYLIEARMESETYAERIKVFLKGKTISREGLHPQPDTILEKM